METGSREGEFLMKLSLAKIFTGNPAPRPVLQSGLPIEK
jgi:hypothetical protein